MKATVPAGRTSNYVQPTLGRAHDVSILRAQRRLVASRQIVDGAKTYTAFSANDLLREDDRAYQPWGLLV